MKCIITDDEQNSRETLRYLLAAIAPEVIILAEASNTAQTKLLLQQLQPDLLFLDINMPGQTGIEFLEQNSPINCQVIFTTAYNEYAIKAFRLNAIDFLLKPIDPDDLEAAIKKAKQQQLLLMPEQIASAKTYLQQKSNSQEQRLALSTAEGIYFINIRDIIYLEALGSYTKFQVKGHKPIIVSKVLKEYDELLAGLDFVRPHQSSLVNMHQISKYVKGEGGQLWMSDGTEIEVSRRRKDQLMQALKTVVLKG